MWSKLRRSSTRFMLHKKGCKFFEGFQNGDVKAKRQKLGKKKNLIGSWEGPYDFVGYKDPKRVLKSKMKGA